MKELPFVSQAIEYKDRIAVRDGDLSYTYAELLSASADLAGTLLNNETDLNESPVALIAKGGFENITSLWAVWRAGGIALPISISATEPEIEYALLNSGATRLIVPTGDSRKFTPICKRLGIQLVTTGQTRSEVSGIHLPEICESRRAMILYTSGTTSKPKGVVTTHANIRAQIESLVEAWDWRKDDSIPLFLPMHHIHGIINVTCCALWVGATIETFPRFLMESILTRVAQGAYTLFMAVPTIYVKLIEKLEDSSLANTEKARVLEGFAAMRLMVSGSAALPPSVHGKWFSLTRQRLLERYGMTETGMTLSNPLKGERRAGAVGLPLPGVHTRRKSESGEIVEAPGDPGELQIRGPMVFKEYWNLPEITEASFDKGWFRTGDVAVIEEGYYRIMGRLSVDIIKSGGYKLSALEIEAILLEHPDIRECAVVGVSDETWGEAVAAAVVLNQDSETLTLPDLREWAGSRLSKYKLPSRLALLHQLPRNAMGKVTKPAVLSSFP